MTAKKIVDFNVAPLLSTHAAIAEYMSQVFADGESDEIIRALGHVAKARGMAMLARESGLGRESLYKALAPGAKPRFDTVLRVCRALKLPLQPVAG